MGYNPNTMSYINKNIFTGIITTIIIISSFFVSTPNNKAFACTGNGDCFPPVQGSCYANVSSGQTGDIITWTADAYDGNGYYSYDWSGTDGLSSFYPVIDKRYDTSGTKNASVQITSYGVTITRTCSVVISDQYNNNTCNNGATNYPSCNNNNYNNLSGYCQGTVSNSGYNNSNSQINWSVYPSGGNGNYTYYWSGDASGSGQNVYQNYYNNNSGTKYATVTIY